MGSVGPWMAHKKSKKVEQFIRGRHSNNEQCITNAHTVESLDFTTQSMHKREIADCKHLEDIKEELIYL